MKVLYLDCGMGIAGDMLMGALYECLPDKQLFWDKVKELQIPGVEIEAVETKKCGITGTHMKVMVHGQEEISEDEHDHHHHDHSFEHSHSHEHNREQDHHHDHDHIHSHDLEHEHHHEQDLSAEHVKANETLVNTGFDNNAENAHERNNDNFDHQSHHHHHHHAHTSMKNIEDMVSQFSLDELIKKRVLSVYEKIAEAEAKVHGTAISEIHFHEVGNMDAVADIVCNMILLNLLKVDRIIASPINVGFGKVRCAHGILPVPAPATAEILKGVPVYAGRFEGEMCTPTGAALYQTIVDETAQMPVMSMETFGYGCGTKDFPAANVVRAVIGETAQEKDHIIELACNLDDMTAEDIALASELLMLHGALDVFTTSIQMKKNRPGTLLSVLCREDQKSKLAELIFKHTTTIGIREYSCDRMVLDRKMGEVSTPYGTMHYKEVSGYGVNRSKIEFDDLREAVEKYEKSIRDIRSEIEKLL